MKTSVNSDLAMLYRLLESRKRLLMESDADRLLTVIMEANNHAIQSIALCACAC